MGQGPPRETDTDPDLLARVGEIAAEQPSERTRAKRETDGAVLTLRLKWPQIVAIMGLLSTPGGFAAWKSFNADHNASTAQSAAGTATDAAMVARQLDEAGYAAVKQKLDATADLAAQCVSRKEFEAEKRRSDRILGRRLRATMPPPEPITAPDVPAAVEKPLPATPAAAQAASAPPGAAP